MKSSVLGGAHAIVAEEARLERSLEKPEKLASLSLCLERRNARGMILWPR